MKYTQLLPFLDKDELKKVASEVISGEIKNVRLETLFPFLDHEALNDLVAELIQKKDSKTLQKTLPFISRSKVQEIYESAQRGELPDFDTTHCIPFLDPEQVKKIFRDLISQSVDTSSEDDEDDDDEERSS